MLRRELIKGMSAAGLATALPSLAGRAHAQARAQAFPTRPPWKTMKDFIEFAKANPGKIDYGSTGVGTTPHLAVEEFAQRAGIKLNHVPYRGNDDLMQGILGGQVMAASDSTGWAPHVDSGRLRLLATYGSRRTKKWPDVPTLNELGYETVAVHGQRRVHPLGREDVGERSARRRVASPVSNRLRPAGTADPTA